MDIILKYFPHLTGQQIRQFKELEGLYRDWNNKINLISRKDIDSLYEKHVLHSLSIAAVFFFEPGTTIIDIGTGGGFPGIPLAIFFPEVYFHLVDSIAKKLKVVEAVAKGIGLKNVTTQHTRAEDIKDNLLPGEQKNFDFAVSRAVAPLKDLWTWSKPLLKTTKKNETRDKKHALPTHPSPLTTHDSRFPINDSRLSTTDYRLPTPGLICLKGGNLADEIKESGTRPRVIGLADLFSEIFFKEKFLLYVSR